MGGVFSWGSNGLRDATWSIEQAPIMVCYGPFLIMNGIAHGLGSRRWSCGDPWPVRRMIGLSLYLSTNM